MVGITEISAIVAAAGVLVGVVYYILDMRQQMQIRQTDMVMGLYATFGSTEFQRAYQKVARLEFEGYTDFGKKYGADIEVWTALFSVVVFFEGIGVLVKRKLTSMNLVEDLFDPPIIQTWERLAPIVKGYRESWKRPIGESFEYLYDEMKKREQQLAQRTA